MLDKYFGFLNIEDEYSVIESLVEHCRIDEEELTLLGRMVDNLVQNDMASVEDSYLKIRKINTDSHRIFENIAEQIINANFDQQKQYDLLRIFQRLERISGLIIASAKRILILKRIGGHLPQACHASVLKMTQETLHIHEEFQRALTEYRDKKKDIIGIINRIEEIEHNIDHTRSACLEVLYKLGNEGDMPMGNFRAIENIIEHIESVSDAIEEAATSLEWLLIY